MSKVSLISDILPSAAVKPTSSGYTGSSSRSAKTQEKFSEPKAARILTSMVETSKFQRCEKKWFAAFFATVIIFLLTSSFSLTALDNFMMRRGVDIFGSSNNNNEVIVSIVQFVLIFALLMWLLKNF